MTNADTPQIATVTIGDTKAELPLISGSEGVPSVDFSTFTKQTGHTSLDYGFVNTASTKSSITYIDGDQGVRWEQWSIAVPGLPGRGQPRPHAEPARHVLAGLGPPEDPRDGPQVRQVGARRAAAPAAMRTEDAGTPSARARRRTRAAFAAPSAGGPR